MMGLPDRPLWWWVATGLITGLLVTPLGSYLPRLRAIVGLIVLPVAVLTIPEMLTKEWHAIEAAGHSFPAWLWFVGVAIPGRTLVIAYSFQAIRDYRQGRNPPPCES